jgi:glycosyltransferase involved in cell wall biosynthesis
MRILIFLDTDHVSGPARLAIDFCVEAQQRGHALLMLALVRGAVEPPNAFVAACAAAGVPVQVIHERRRFDPGVVRQFKAALQDFKPDVYQSHGYKGSMLGKFARRAGVAWQAVFHGFTWENWKVRLYHWLDVRWLRRAHEVIAVSRPFIEALAKGGVRRERLRWIPNAISKATLLRTDSGEDLRTAWGLREGEVLIGVLGRFSPEKAPDHFIRAFARIAPSQPALRAVLVGDGPLRESCLALARELGLAQRIVFPGFRSDLAAIYRAIDVLAIPSRSEGMPTVLIEAMLLGVPAISTAVGAVPDVIREGETGLIVPIGDEAALGAGLARLGTDAALRGRIADAARAFAEQRLIVEQRTQTLVDHMRAIRAGKLPPAVEWTP